MACFLVLVAVCLLPALKTGAVDPSISTQLLWPMPSSVSVGSDVFSISDPTSFKFTPQGANAGSDTLKQAIARYSDLIFKSPVPLYPSASNASTTKDLSELTITVSSTDEKLGLDTDESCEHEFIFFCMGICIKRYEQYLASVTRLGLWYLFHIDNNFMPDQAVPAI